MRTTELGLILMIFLVIFLGGRYIHFRASNQLKDASNVILLNKLDSATEHSKTCLKLIYKLDSIADNYQSSRNAKQNCKECLDLAQKLN